MARTQPPSYNRRRAKRTALATLGVVEKRPRAGHNVSHALNRTKRVFKPNLQKAKIMVDGRLVSVRVDTRTLRSLTKALKDRPERQPKKATAKPAAKAARSTKTPAKK